MPDPKTSIKAAVEAVRKLREAAGKTAEEIAAEKARADQKRTQPE